MTEVITQAQQQLITTIQLTCVYGGNSPLQVPVVMDVVTLHILGWFIPAGPGSGPAKAVGAKSEVRIAGGSVIFVSETPDQIRAKLVEAGAMV